MVSTEQIYIMGGLYEFHTHAHFQIFQVPFQLHGSDFYPPIFTTGVANTNSFW